MGKIQVLDQNTIDKIAAGEVVERPSSVVKELVENAVDAKATAITVEIKEGGTTFLRVTDNGSGIPSDQVRLAFLRHSTSKIRSVEDLTAIASLGFRGEALSSIAAVSMVELITKEREAQTGIRYCIEGGQEKELEEAAAPEGTTFLIRSLFYNTPARRKFLRSPMTEGGYIGDLMERMALSRPDISFRFINNGQTRMHTAGNHSLRDVIYQIYGREITENLIPVEGGQGPIRVAGFIGKPLIGRGNRNFETYFVNGRYVKSSLIAKGIEEAYQTMLMQHKYPFVVLNFTVDGRELDVNVHPTKMELRFSDQEQVVRFVRETLREALLGGELIPRIKLGPEERVQDAETKTLQQTEETKTLQQAEESRTLQHAEESRTLQQAEERKPLQQTEETKSLQQTENAKSLQQDMTGRAEEKGRRPETTKEKPGNMEQLSHDMAGTGNRQDVPGEQNTEEGWKQAARAYEPRERNLEYFLEEMQKRVRKAHEKPGLKTEEGAVRGEKVPWEEGAVHEEGAAREEKSLREKGSAREEGSVREERVLREEKASPVETLREKNDYHVEEKPGQLELFEEKFLDPKKKEDIRLIGQLFETYWLVQKGDCFYMIDQHAAHEKVLFERLMAQTKQQEVLSQMVSPPLVLSLNLAEIQTLQSFEEAFAQMGFTVEPFGGKEYAISAVPAELYGIAEKELFLEMLDELSDNTGVGKGGSRMILEKLASMSCKAAVKGNQRLSQQEAKELIDTLFTLENPYTCPHGRPTIISMTRQEIERRFKRIVS